MELLEGGGTVGRTGQDGAIVATKIRRWDHRGQRLRRRGRDRKSVACRLARCGRAPPAGGLGLASCLAMVAPPASGTRL